MTTVTMIAVQAELTSRWAIGEPATADDGVKLPVAANPLTGAPVIPGSSVAGSLKRHLGSVAEEWMGLDPEDFEQATRNKVRKPSRLAVLGILVEASTNTAGSTKIDPRRGAAAGTSLRHYEWANKTPDFTIALQHDGSVDEALAQLLRTWPLQLGRGRSAGLGQTKVSRVHTLTLDLSKEQDLAFWLGSRTDWFRDPAARDAGQYSCSDGQPAEITWTEVELVAKEPLHVGDGQTRQDGAQRTRETVRLSPGGNPFIPGSSWRGVFRHRIHTILSAVGATETQRDEVLEGLFGSTERGRGPLWFADAVLPDRCVTRTHVAIDRFTGGGHPGLLFKVAAVRHGTDIDLRYSWEHGEIPMVVENLLNHVIRDLHDGLTSVGGMGTRGYGWVATRTGQVPEPGPVEIEKLIQAVLAYAPGKPSDQVPEGSRQ